MILQSIPLLQTIPYMGPARYAVFVNEEGKPYFETLVAFGSCLFNPEREGKTLVGFTMGVEHLHAADIQDNFVGWEDNGEKSKWDRLADWGEAAKAKLAMMNKVKAEKAAAKIVIPNQQGVVATVKV